MGKCILVTGGARSGKSSFAEKVAQSLGDNILYIATAVPFDDEMKDRIAKHKSMRPAHWETYEGYKNLGTVIKNEGSRHSGILLDCITVMITNLLFEYPQIDFDNPDIGVLKEAEKFIKLQVDEILDAVKASSTTTVIVTNELGSGVVPENPFARIFRDIAGRINQNIAFKADEVYLTVCGIPMKIK